MIWVLADDGEAAGCLVALVAILIVVATILYIGFFLLAACALAGAVAGVGVAIYNFVKVVQEAHAKIA